MAASPLNTKSNFHARSNSLPSTPHPLFLQCNEHLERLKSSHETSSSSSLLTHKLVGLQDLHECVEKLVQLPLTQQALLNEPQQNWVDEILDGSLRLLDVCTTAKDSLLHTKECMRELQSIMRRRKGGDDGIIVEAKKFLTSRKVVKKAISKALVNLKAISKKGNFSSNIKDQQTMALVGLLKDVEVVTLSVFESMLNFICGSTQSKAGNWSLVSKLIHTKRIGCSQVVEESEFSHVDVALHSFVLHMTNKSSSDNISNLPNHLEKLESRIQDFEEGLEFLFRRMIKIRVSLLNILNH
ncbi:hypothetical protein TanjilG_17305 [Lupinus angustifolius]|uniref:DUF241 domain protein n=2 Tax=Lupinus angustifolius TaxID=3871 RepID=A0A4P1R1H0_LUPAN|nr:PREDICTED: uncharacterized protein LOC109363469 [Lupinus angustifolius]OIV99495.1 hypothetical protein TanjilG_17305 [Lupinus angustifolius]